MDDNNIFLCIDVNYANTKLKIKKEELISYNELREKSIKYFKIDIKNGDNVEFIYQDEDNEKNILEHDDKELFSAAKYIDDNYLLNLDLIIINNRNSNHENQINENEKQVNNNKAKLDKKEIDKEGNNNKFENKLKQVSFLFKNQFNLMQSNISKMINKKYKEIENELIKLKLNEEINHLIINENIEKERIERYKDKNQNEDQKENKLNKINENESDNFEIIDKKREIIVREVKNNKDYDLIEKRTIFPNNINKKDDFCEINKINKENINCINDYDNTIASHNSEELEEEDNNYDKDGNNQLSFFSSNNNSKKIKEKLDKIKKHIKELNKSKNFSYNDIISKGKNIFDIMNKDKEKDNNNRIEVNQINKYIKDYLNEEHKKDISFNDKIKYCNILKYLNHFLEIKNIQATLDDNLKEEIEFEINFEKQIKDNIIGENIKDESKIKELFDSFNKINNKIYVQQKLEGLIKNLHKKK